MKSDEQIIIIIPKWRKYQRQLKGTSRHRNWFAVNSSIAHDPDFMSLSVADRYAWIMLLADASLRGVEQESGQCWVKVCTKLFISLYKLRRNFDFSSLENQGFIQIRKPTEQDKQDRTNIPVGAAKLPSKKAEVNHEGKPPKSTDSGNPKDPNAEMIWRTGLAMLVNSGMVENTARARLGKLVKTYSEKTSPQHAKEKLAAAIATALVNRPVDPIAYITASMADRPENRSNFQQNVTAISEWLEESNA